MYKLEFTFFCGLLWSHTTITITANSMIQLMRHFLMESKYINGYMGYYKNTKHLWNEVKNDIEIVEFPIITRKIG